MSRLGVRLDADERARRRRARRALLRRPLQVREECGDLWKDIVSERRALAEWFMTHAGWKLVVDVSAGFARLHKTSRDAGFRRTAVAGQRNAPMDRRRYVLLCFTLAALDEAHRQTTLARLAEAVAEQSREEPGLAPFDAASYAERRAFVDVLRWLTDHGVLVPKDGSPDRYAHAQEADALFDVRERLLGQLLCAPVSPALAGTPERMVEETYPETEDGRRLRARHAVVRRLLDEPVLYFDDLAPAEREWLEQSRSYLWRLLEEIGLLVERRREGAAPVDPEGELTDVLFPEGGSTVKHAALLLAEWLVASRGKPVMTRNVESRAAELMEEYGGACGWRREYQTETGPARLAADALALLQSMGLVRACEGGWRPLPAAARFGAAAPAPAGRGDDR